MTDKSDKELYELLGFDNAEECDKYLDDNVEKFLKEQEELMAQSRPLTKLVEDTVRCSVDDSGDCGKACKYLQGCFPMELQTYYCLRFEKDLSKLTRLPECLDIFGV